MKRLISRRRECSESTPQAVSRQWTAQDITTLDDDTAGALAGLDVLEEYEGSGRDREFVGYTKKYKIADKLRALEALGKHLGLFDKGGGDEDNEGGGIAQLPAVMPSGAPPEEG